MPQQEKHRSWPFSDTRSKVKLMAVSFVKSIKLSVIWQIVWQLAGPASSSLPPSPCCSTFLSPQQNSQRCAGFTVKRYIPHLSWVKKVK